MQFVGTVLSNLFRRVGGGAIPTLQPPQEQVDGKPKNERNDSVFQEASRVGAAKNGNFRNGDWTAEAIEERKWLRSLVRSFAKTGTTG